MTKGFDRLYDLREKAEAGAKEKTKSEAEKIAENVEISFFKEHDYKLEAFQVYKAHQEAIKKSELLQCEILKGVSTKEDVTTLFLKACEIVSLLTGTKEFYAQVKRGIEK